MLYELAAARVPFEGRTGGDVLVSILSNEPIPLQRHSPDIPAELQRIVRKALRKDAEERYQLVKELALDLKLAARVDFNAELEISQQPSAPGMRTSGTGATQSGVRNAASASRTAEIASPKPTSTAEYLVSEIKSHRGILALLVELSVVGAGHRADSRVPLVVITETSTNKTSNLTRNMKSCSAHKQWAQRDKAAISPDGKYLVHVAKRERIAEFARAPGQH